MLTPLTRNHSNPIMPNGSPLNVPSKLRGKTAIFPPPEDFERQSWSMTFVFHNWKLETLSNSYGGFLMICHEFFWTVHNRHIKMWKSQKSAIIRDFEQNFRRPQNLNDVHLKWKIKKAGQFEYSENFFFELANPSWQWKHESLSSFFHGKTSLRPLE